MATATENPDSKMTTATKPEKHSMIGMDRMELEIEEGEDDFDPAVVSQNLRSHGGDENLELFKEVYYLASRGEVVGLSGRLLPDSSILEGFRSPMDNTALHLAALHGNYEMVDRVATQCPDLLFSVNKNKETPLHVAARAGNVSTLIKLLEACDMTRVSELMKKQNRQGNIMLHEAMMCHGGSMVSKFFHDLEACTTLDNSGRSLSETCSELALNALNRKKESVLCLAVKASITETVSRILEKCPEGATPEGISPLKAAIMNRDKVMLDTILSKKQEWMHLEDVYGRLPLHWAASTGYQEGVVYLLDKCMSCTLRKDAYGLLPLHLAAREGHLEVLEELLKHCPDPTEMLGGEYHRNILHIAAQSGKLDVVRYILQTPTLEKMINQKDKNGDTPLHVATSMRHTKIVYALIGDDRVDLNVVNKENQTALDIVADAMRRQKSLSFREIRLLMEWTAAGAKTSPCKARRSSKSASDERQVDAKRDILSTVDSLIVISTLIVTASVTACFSVPGEAQGTANNLHKPMFSLFIICITMSFFSSISATIILLFVKLAVAPIEVKSSAISFAMQLTGSALITLLLAFVGGVYTVISKLTWLATTFVVLSLIDLVTLSALIICSFIYLAYKVAVNYSFKIVSYLYL